MSKILAPYIDTCVALLLEGGCFTGRHESRSPRKLVVEAARIFDEDENVDEVLELWSGYSKPPRLYWQLRESRVNLIELGNEEEGQWRSAMQRFKRGSGIPDETWMSLKKSIGFQKLFSQEKTWVLRNLTTKEVVRSEGGKKSKRVRLEEVLLARISWSIYSGRWHSKAVPTAVEDEWHSGKWTGHEFDIVCKEVHLDEGEEGWVDVTEQVVREGDLENYGHT